ncbi:MAG: alpha-amylase family glycosyl hydrolase [Bacteroides sp.]|jgi:glycosidase|nr:alpha-amylase family glycosyl hydrolase [Bacteroides sp.]
MMKTLPKRLKISKASPFFRLLSLLFLFLLFFSACAKDPAPPEEEEYTQYGTPFTGIPAVEDLVVYEVNLRAFSPEGTLQGVIEGLDHIRSLGVNVIWLMPIHPIGQINSVNSPYSVQDYLAVSPEYGSLEDLRQLTDAAHQRGMAVIMDWVANHTAWDHPWISNTGWYTTDDQGNIIHPPGTNWLDVADLNFSSFPMRKALTEAMKYWLLEANVDGFRCDYADGVPFDFWRTAIEELREIPGRTLVMLAEGGRSDHFQAGFDMTYAWTYYARLKDVFNGQNANVLYTTHTSEFFGVPQGKQLLRFTTNHDESAWDATPMTLFNGQQGALAASVATTFMGGVPLIYTGQEVGRVNTLPFFSQSPVDWTANPTMLAAYQDLMEVYVQSNAARKGELVNHSSTNVVCFKKTWQDEELLVMVNIRNSNQDFSLPAEIQNTTWEDAFSNATVSLGITQSLAPYQYLILK